MFQFIMTALLCLLCPVLIWAQANNTEDTLQGTPLEEIVVIATHGLSVKTAKPLSSIEDYLEKAGAVNMVRRGNYGYEPFINGMASERSVVTIDGMRIYGACTDKMDPVTSYVEITNLARADVHSGQSGPTGATIGGSLNLERKKSSFGAQEFRGSAFTGFETNNSQKILGGTVSYSDEHIFSDVDVTFRDAKNYKAGGGEEILYAQFTKYNASATVGYKISGHEHVAASMIYDQAVNVGYPALPMDVSLAKAFISSVEYVRHLLLQSVNQWHTKFYYNNVTHIMDDSKRPVVPIRMDMPGWSRTAGFYSLLEGGSGRHSWKANISGHHNYSLAEMTMHANDPNEKDMFMLTWPGVQTNYGDIFMEDAYHLSAQWTANISAGMAVHHNMVDDQLGLESMRIFYPGMKKNKTRLLKRVAASVAHRKENWAYNFGLAYGERAPGVSEGYGFYLFNSFDRYDYIGNPEMKNEKSVSLSSGLSFTHAKFSAKLSANYFYISGYILGIPKNSLSVMTIGAAGVKVYDQLKYANIFNANLDLHYLVTDNLFWTNKLSYRMGKGEKVNNLPLMQPLTYSSTATCLLKNFSADISANGSAAQNNFNADFGEQKLPAYVVFNLSASNYFHVGKQSFLVKAGAENIFDRRYTTFADWNRLPRMGRNFYINLIYNF